jgi:TonB family protein
VDDWAGTIEELRQRQFRRVVGISAAFHGVALLFLVWNPIPQAPAALPGVVAVRFVSLPSPGPAASKAEAEPEAPPPPKPIPPVQKKVVLPVEPKKIEPPKPKPEVKVEPKPEAKQPEKKPEVKPQPKPPEQDYDDVLAQLRTQAGETAKAPAAATATVPGPALGMPGSASGVPLSPEEAAWYQRAKIHLARSWMLAPGFRTQALSALVRVELDAQGNLVGTPELERRSGNPWYDDSTVRAVQKASPLPPPPSAGEYTIEFRPEEFF